MPLHKEPKVYLFLSEILGQKVLDADGQTLGAILDLAGSVGEIYPPVTGILVMLSYPKRLAFIPWQRLTDQDGMLVVAQPAGEDFPPPEPRPGEPFLTETLLDKQVVDTNGTKVRRVNDLQFLKARNGLYLVHVDVGFHGLLRRVGLARPIAWLLRVLFDYRLKDQLISWKDVQPLSSPDLLRLKVAQDRLGHLHPVDLSDIIEELDIHNRSSVFQSLDLETAAETLEETDPKSQVTLIEALDTADASDITEEMALPEAAGLLGERSFEKAKELLQEMKREAAQDVTELLVHPDETAGGLMTTSFLGFPPERTVAEATAVIRQTGADLDVIYYLYVLDPQEHLLGLLSLRDLLAAHPRSPLGEIMDTRVVSVTIEEKKQRIAEDFAKYGILAMPVVDGENRMAGVILFKTFLEVVAPKLGR